MKLSISMIVKNEESCLEKCLQSVVGADELVVVDTGSEDKTKEIALKFDAKMFDFPWCDDFAAARNYSLKQCTGDWIFTIDADEELEPDGIGKIREAIANAGAKHTIGIRIRSKRVGEFHISPRVYKRCPEVFWKGEIHNHLSISETNPSNIQIMQGYSEAHKKDPDRALRILTKVMQKNPLAVREAYYLAREYWYKRDYATAVLWYENYLKRATWSPEMADAWLMVARCKWQMHQGEEARSACLQAIKINADFKEALLFMAEMSGPKNRERWKLFASFAENEDVLFVRDPQPKPSTYYDQLFAASKNMSRYEQLLKKAASWTNGRVLDICCGTGELSKHIEDYEGIDFSKEAISGNPKLRQGNVFDEVYNGYDTYVILEALEHVNDLELLNKLPSGADVVFSVPSFNDPSHVRTYNEKIVRLRYSELLKIEKVVRFNWTGKKWDKAHPDTPSYILLIKATRH